MKTDMSAGAIDRRLRRVAQLRRLCLSLAAAGTRAVDNSMRSVAIDRSGSRTTNSLRAEDCLYNDVVTDVRIEDVASLYESVGFGVAEQYTRDVKTMDALFGSGAYAFFAREPGNHKMIGMVRVLSDDRFCTWVAEVCVDPEYQRLGIGSELIRLVVERFGHTAIYGEALSEQTDFFAKLGIKPRKSLVAISRAAQRTRSSGPKAP